MEMRMKWLQQSTFTQPTPASPSHSSTYYHFLRPRHRSQPIGLLEEEMTITSRLVCGRQRLFPFLTLCWTTTDAWAAWMCLALWSGTTAFSTKRWNGTRLFFTILWTLQLWTASFSTRSCTRWRVTPAGQSHTHRRLSGSSLLQKCWNMLKALHLHHPPPPLTCGPMFYGKDVRIRKYCRNCHDAGKKRVKTPWHCVKCQVPLCLNIKNNCYQEWHAKIL